MSKIICQTYKSECIPNQNQIIIRQYQNEYLENGQHVNDILIKSENICKNISANLYACILTQNYIDNNIHLPIFNINIILNKFMKQILLFKIYLEFESESNVVVDNTLDGKFNIVLSIENMSQIIDKLNIYHTDENIHSKLFEFIKSQQIINMINDMKNDVIEKFKKELDINFDCSGPSSNYISLKTYNVD